MNQGNPIDLLKQRRFLPLFCTQFLGAFNDNVFKQALIAYFTFYTLEISHLNSHTLTNLSAGLFILPFFLFSATAGQIADKWEKSRLIRWVKILEIGIMMGAVAGFYFKNVYVLFAMLFLMGTHSTFFGPLKYGILPQHLGEHELVAGNGMISMGTFVAILLGTLVGGELIYLFRTDTRILALVMLVLAVSGYTASRYIPQAAPAAPHLNLNLNFITETWRIIAFTRQNRTVFLSILGISWFWFFGATYLTQLPGYSKDILGGNEQLLTFMLILFVAGIGSGSVLCDRLSGHKVEIGLVPFGSIGLTVFGVDLFFATPAAAALSPIGVAEFIQVGSHWRIILDVVMMGMFGGFFIVPLYAMIQQRSEPSHRSRIIAANNILNALFMVISAVLAIVLLQAGFSVPELLLFTALFNAGVAIYIYTLVPEFLMRFLVWLLIHSIYRVRKIGLEKIPDVGPAVLVCNHVSFVDALVIGGCIRRPVRFVMYYKIFKMPILNFIFRTAKAIPIAGSKENPQMFAQAFEEIARGLNNGDMICIFPEGKLTANGEIDTFKSGIERIIKDSPVPVIPLALQGLWHSIFSRKPGNILGRLPKRFFALVSLVAGEAIPPEKVNAALLQKEVMQLRGALQ